MLQTPAATCALACAALTLVLCLIARSVRPDLVNVPIVSGDGRLYYLLTVGSSILVGVLVQRVVDPRSPDRRGTSLDHYLRGADLPTAGVLPAVTVCAAGLLAVRHQRIVDLIALTLLALVAVYTTLTVREYLWSDDARLRRLAVRAQPGISVAIAFVALNAVLLFKARALFTAPAVFLLAWLLLVQVEDGSEANAVRRVAYAILGAWALAEASWGVGYWPPSGWYTGGVLTAILLGIALVNAAQMSGTLTRPLALRYGGAATGLFLAFAWLAR
jgi:hypothetical protein